VKFAVLLSVRQSFPFTRPGRVTLMNTARYADINI